MSKTNENSIKNRSFFKKIAYSTCWEDFNTINNALRIKKNDTLISISSAGDNVLNALLKNPKKILSVDFNPNQNYLLELKIKAIKHLNYEEFLDLIGIIESKDREKLYKKISKKLSKDSQKFWNNNLKLIKKGITYNGRQEKYIKLIGRTIRSFKGDEVCINFLKIKDRKKQEEYFQKNIKNLVWDMFFKFFYSKPVMLLAKDKLVLSQTNDNSVNKIFKQRTEYAVKKIPVYKNPFTSLALIGKYLNEEYYPDYLKKENFQKLKKNIGKIEIKDGRLIEILKKLPNNSYSKFNISNVLDWVSDKEFKETIKEIRRISKKKGRFCYFNTLIKRHIPRTIKNIKSDKKTANKLLKKDRSFLYGNFEVGIIRKGGKIADI